MGTQTRRMGIRSASGAELSEETTNAEGMVRFRIQVYRPGLQDEWVPRGVASEWIAAHPYTAVAQALIGDGSREPLRIRPEEIVSVRILDESDALCWLLAVDLLIIADEIETLASTLGGTE